MGSFQRIFYILFFSTLYYQGGSAGTVVTDASLVATVGHSLDFRCKYTLGAGEIVFAGLISWEMKTDSGFESIATFSPFGGINAFTEQESGLKFKNRSELLPVTSNDNTTFNVVMRVREVECTDEDSYRCSVTFFSPGLGTRTITKETSLTVQAPAEEPYAVPVPVPDNIEEGMNVRFSCTANVGKPPGKIKWWRYRFGITAPQFMGESSETPRVQPKVCVYNVTSAIEHTMSSDDDQSVWRCSVHNVLLTTSPDQNKPYQESQRTNVYYKVRVPTIKPLNAEDRQHPVGSDLTLTCEADGNPRSFYVWTFRASPRDNITETGQNSISSNNGVLHLTNLQRSQTGVYMCTAFNGFNGKSFNASRETYLDIVSEENVSTPKEENMTTSKGHRIADDNTAVITGSVIGAVVLISLLIIVVFVCRRYTCTFNIALKENSGDVGKTTNDSECSGWYMNMAAQNEQTEREHYEQLPERSRVEHQYDHLSVQENPESTQQTYETLQDSTGENKYAKLSYNKDM